MTTEIRNWSLKFGGGGEGSAQNKKHTDRLRSRREDNSAKGVPGHSRWKDPSHTAKLLGECPGFAVSDTG